MVHLPSPLHQVANDLGQQCQVSWRAASGGEGRQAAILGLTDRGEADVVLLDDGGVQAVEVQQQHKLVVQPLLGLQDQAPSKLGGAPLLAACNSRHNDLLHLARLMHISSEAAAFEEIVADLPTEDKCCCLANFFGKQN